MHDNMDTSHTMVHHQVVEATTKDDSQSQPMTLWCHAVHSTRHAACCSPICDLSLYLGTEITEYRAADHYALMFSKYRDDEGSGPTGPEAATSLQLVPRAGRHLTLAMLHDCSNGSGVQAIGGCRVQ